MTANKHERKLSLVCICSIHDQCNHLFYLCADSSPGAPTAKHTSAETAASPKKAVAPAR